MEDIKKTAATDDAEEKDTEKKPEPKPAEGKTDKKKTKRTDAELAALQKKYEAEKKESDDRYMRLMAEYENFRKRSAKEKESIYADAYGDCIGNILPILDNLERASKTDNLEGLKKGLELTVKAFDDALQKMGITEVETKTFDPNLHNAVMHIEDDAYGESEIVEVFQKGYCKGEKVIRYAMVKVAN